MIDLFEQKPLFFCMYLVSMPPDSMERTAYVRSSSHGIKLRSYKLWIRLSGYFWSSTEPRMCFSSTRVILIKKQEWWYMWIEKRLEWISEDNNPYSSCIYHKISAMWSIINIPSCITPINDLYYRTNADVTDGRLTDRWCHDESLSRVT